MVMGHIMTFKDRACACRTQAVEDFMDEDELAEVRGASSVQPTADFDTFGSAGVQQEKQRVVADAAESTSQAPSLTSDPAIEVLLAPVAESLGEAPSLYINKFFHDSSWHGSLGSHRQSHDQHERGWRGSMGFQRQCPAAAYLSVSCCHPSCTWHMPILHVQAEEC